MLQKAFLPKNSETESFPTETKIKIAKALDDFGVDYVRSPPPPSPGPLPPTVPRHTRKVF